MGRGGNTQQETPAGTLWQKGKPEQHGTGVSTTWTCDKGEVTEVKRNSGSEFFARGFTDSRRQHSVSLGLYSDLEQAKRVVENPKLIAPAARSSIAITFICPASGESVTRTADDLFSKTVGYHADQYSSSYGRSYGVDCPSCGGSHELLT